MLITSEVFDARSSTCESQLDHLNSQHFSSVPSCALKKLYLLAGTTRWCPGSLAERPWMIFVAWSETIFASENKNSKLNSNCSINLRNCCSLWRGGVPAGCLGFLIDNVSCDTVWFYTSRTENLRPLRMRVSELAVTTLTNASSKESSLIINHEQTVLNH